MTSRSSMQAVQPAQSGGQGTEMSESQQLHFTCNICGGENDVAVAALDREKRSCIHCGSSVRTRSVIHLLSMSLFGHSLSIDEFPESPTIHGIGLSDWPVYAKRLTDKLDYTNTYYHQEPRLDITAVPEPLYETCDFIISTDVFEHVLSPVSDAFRGAWKLLKPGGAMIFSVPFTNRGTETVEHFDALHDFEILNSEGKYRLVNRRADGRVDTYDNLRFHGGPGETLEMRLFCRQSLLEELEAAGFSVELFDYPVPQRGIVWQQSWSVPMLARKA